MERSSKTQLSPEVVLGEYLALAAAVRLARTQLTADPLKVHDEELDFVALALARTVPLYAAAPAGSEPRQLTPLELEGAVPRNGATLLVLRDGRALAGVTVRRGDLRQAIAILRAVGLGDAAPVPHAKAAAPNGAESLLARAAELETLIDAPGEVERAKKAALWIARNSVRGQVANLAMQLMSALQEQRDADACRAILARLRQALNQEAV
jgi:hypothetical protein